MEDNLSQLQALRKVRSCEYFAITTALSVASEALRLAKHAEYFMKEAEEELTLQYRLYLLFWHQMNFVGNLMKQNACCVITDR